MIAHKPDNTCKTLKSCWKRAESFAKKGIIDSSHKLAAAWSNCKLFCDAEDLRPMNLCESYAGYEKYIVSEMLQTIVYLDWFATKINDYAKNNIINGDTSVAAILYEWQEKMMFNPIFISKH